MTVFTPCATACATTDINHYRNNTLHFWYGRTCLHTTRYILRHNVADTKLFVQTNRFSIGFLLDSTREFWCYPRLIRRPRAIPVHPDSSTVFFSRVKNNTIFGNRLNAMTELKKKKKNFPKCVKTKESCICCLGFRILRKNLMRFAYTARCDPLSSRIQGNVSIKCPFVFPIYIDLLTPSCYVIDIIRLWQRAREFSASTTITNLKTAFHKFFARLQLGSAL